jgi:hypothetical protein
MSMRLTETPKPEFQKNKFEQHNDNLRDQKQFVKEQAAAPKVERTAPPRTRNGRLIESPALTEARRNMEADRENAQAETAHKTRFQAIAQDTQTVGALVNQWISQTPSFVSTLHNKTSLANAVNEWLLKGRVLSVAALNDIFDLLVEGNYLERSGHARVRGQGGIMSGRPTIYPVYETPAEQRQQAVVLKRSENVASRTDGSIDSRTARHMELSELGAIVKANYRNSPTRNQQVSTETISEADARSMPLDDLKKHVRANYGKGRS